MVSCLSSSTFYHHTFLFQDKFMNKLLNLSDNEARGLHADHSSEQLTPRSEPSSPVDVVHSKYYYNQSSTFYYLLSFWGILVYLHEFSKSMVIHESFYESWIFFITMKEVIQWKRLSNIWTKTVVFRRKKLVFAVLGYELLFSKNSAWAVLLLYIVICFLEPQIHVQVFPPAWGLHAKLTELTNYLANILIKSYSFSSLFSLLLQQWCICSIYLWVSTFLLWFHTLVIF